MQHRLEPRRLLTEQEEREIKAALELAGTDQKKFAAKKGVSYTRMNRMISRKEVVTPDYAKLFIRLIRSTLGQYATAA